MGLISMLSTKGRTRRWSRLPDIIEDPSGCRCLMADSSRGSCAWYCAGCMDVTGNVASGANAVATVVEPCSTTIPRCPEKTSPADARESGMCIDDALWFYYDENLQALQHAGGRLVRLSITTPEPWPEIDALYLGGGFPETLHNEIFF